MARGHAPETMRLPLARSERRLVAWLFVLTAAVLLLFQEGAITGYDGRVMYEVTRSIVERQSVTVPHEWSPVQGLGGHYYGKYGIGLSLVGVCPYAAVHALAAGSGRIDALGEAAVSATMPLITAALVAAIYLLARRLGARAGPALLVAAGSVAGTFLLPYGKELFSEPLTALGIVVGIERTLAGQPAAAGGGLAIAILARPQSLAFAPMLLFTVARRDGIKGLLHALVPVSASLLLTLVYNLVRFGKPLSFGYGQEGFTTPFVRGAAGLLLDPAKSVLLFAPVVLLVPLALTRLWRTRRERDAFTLITTNLAITFVLTATWHSWMGGWSWGPRLLIPGLVPAFAAIGPWLDGRARWAAAVALLTVGFVASAATLVVSTQAQQLDTPRPPIGPGIVRQTELVGPTVRHSASKLYQPDPDGRNYLRYLSLWQVGSARVFKRPGLALAVAGTLALVGMVVWSASRLNRYLQVVASRQEVALTPDHH
jgi:hypothetical protein